MLYVRVSTVTSTPMAKGEGEDVYVPADIPVPTNFVGIGIKVIRGIRVLL